VKAGDTVILSFCVWD